MASSSSNPQFTPGRQTSHSVHSSDFTPPVTAQEELKNRLGYEIENHTWHFNAKRFAAMLSRKVLKSDALPLGRNLDSIDRYVLDVQMPKFDSALTTAYQILQTNQNISDWPGARGEAGFYTPLCDFLSACVSSCNAGLDSIGYRSERFYSHLRFVPYDKPTKDGVGGAYPVKPDGAGVLEVSDEDINTHGLFWRSPDKPVLHIPIEVKDQWPELVRQAASYAQCLFNAHPLRQFALVIGFNHNPSKLSGTRELRFLLFHRGGLTASMPLSVDRGAGREDILRIFFALMTWETVSDAGFPPWCNDTEFCLSRDPSSLGSSRIEVLATVDNILHNSICVRGRGVRVSEISYPLSQEPTSCTASLLVSPPRPALKPETQLRRSTRILALAQSQHQVGQPDPTKSSSSYDKRSRRVGVKSFDPFQVNTNPQDRVTEGNSVPEIVYSRREQEPGMMWPWNTPTTNSYPLLSDPGSTSRGHAVIKSSWIQDKHKTVEKELLHVCRDDFGTAKHHFSFEGYFQNGQPITNVLYLPTKDEILDVYWDVFKQLAPASPDYRTLVVHILKPAGQSLIRASSPWELMLSIGHSMIGWLAMCLRGFQHRDISIGNILLLVPSDNEAPSNDFEHCFAALSSVSSRDVLGGLLELKDLFAKLDDGETDCMGMVIDGDMAIKWEEYFHSTHEGSRSGTREFMSIDLLWALQRGKDYLITPLDDLYSFYYVAQWAAVFAHSNSPCPLLDELQAAVVQERSYVRRILRRTDPVEHKRLLPFPMGCKHILAEWYNTLDELGSEWDLEVEKAPPASSSTAQKYEFYVPRFQKLASRGVVEYYRLLLKHRTTLQLSYEAVHLLLFPVILILFMVVRLRLKALEEAPAK